MHAAAKAIGTTKRSLDRYGETHPWYADILEAANARGMRAVILANLEGWEAFEAGDGEQPGPFVWDPPPPPPSTPTEPEVLAASYRPRASRDVRDVRDPHGRADGDGVLAVDPDLVLDADRDLELPSHALTRVDEPDLPPLTIANVLALIWRTANDRTHPACPAAQRKIAEIAVAPLVRAQAQRERMGARTAKGAIDVEASELGASGSRPVFIRMPKNDTEARGRGPGGTE